MAWQNNVGGWQGGGGGGRGPWGNGPQGPRGPQQPPNIDEMIRKGQDRLRRFLPGNAGGRAGFVLFLLLILLLWLASGVYRVGANEQGVVLRFGKWVETTGSGLHWHIPWPIETALTPPVTDRKRVDIGFQQGVVGRGRSAGMLDESLMLTGDENIVDNSFTVFWRIKDAGRYLFNIQSPQELTVKSVAESVMREIVGQTPIQSALTEGRQVIEFESRNRIQAVLDDYQAGITILDVKLEKVDPPGQVIDAFRDVQAAEADRERFRNEADLYANKIIPEARGRANQMFQEAEAYREQVIAKAQGEADRFLSVYEQYRQAKDVTRKRIYLETMEQVLRDMDKLIMDSTAGTGVVPYLALPELKKRNSTEGGQ